MLIGGINPSPQQVKLITNLILLVLVYKVKACADFWGVGFIPHVFYVSLTSLCLYFLVPALRVVIHRLSLSTKLKLVLIGGINPSPQQDRSPLYFFWHNLLLRAFLYLDRTTSLVQLILKSKRRSPII